MRRRFEIIESGTLQRKFDIGVYGHFGLGLLMFPAFSDNPFEYEENGLINSLEQYITHGKVKIYTLPSINGESWLDNSISHEQRSEMHYHYNTFIIEELLPFVYNDCGGPIPLLTSGCSIGAYHAANTYFRRPDLFIGTIALSGFYDISRITDGFFNENCYFNSPSHYLPNLNDNYWLSFLKSRHHCYFYSGSGENEDPGETEKLASLLQSKEIPHQSDIWGEECGHNYDTWKNMLIKIISTKL